MPLGSYLFGHSQAGKLRFGRDSAERHYLPGDAYLVAQPDAPCAVKVDGLRTGLAVLTQAMVDSVAQSAPGVQARPIEFTGYQPISPQAGDFWKATYAYLQEAVLGDETMAAHPLVVANATRILVSASLIAFPNSAVLEPLTEDRRDAHTHTLRRAIAYIESHPEQPLTMAEIAAAADVTIRAVQLAFRRHLGTTPMGYLRRVRLDLARTELLDAVPGTTVTAVAARWGFTHSSRFGAAYRAAYGEQPHQTLSRSRR
jgi:AraC-like DNA-binding protein